MANSLTSLTVKILRGDAKVLLAFNLDKKDTKDLAGFTIQCAPNGIEPYYIFNKLQFADPSLHAQVTKEPANSSLNAPIQKFRWLHVPGGIHQTSGVIYGNYLYTVTPRYLKKGALLPIDKSLSVTGQVNMAPFTKGNIELGFTRGFTQSQAFTNHFGVKATFKPKNAELLFDTGVQAGVSNDGDNYTYKDEYIWSGFTAREKIFKFIEEVINDKTLFLDVFAYDLSEPDLMRFFLQLATEGRIRIMLDSASLHHDTKPVKKPKPEDLFEIEFNKVDQKPNGTPSILRGNFKRFQHHKVMIVSKGKNRTPVKIMSGSTNFSVTGMYANSNHVIIFNDTEIAKQYQKVFDQVWADKITLDPFVASEYSKTEYPFTLSGINLFITFAPHDAAHALVNLNKIVTRIKAEQSSVLFAVMGTDRTTTGPVAPCLIDLHKRTDIFSAGISDSKNNIYFYKPSSTTGIKVTGLPGKTILPPPFDEERSIDIGHQVHHKFVVCGFNTPDAVVWLGSSNLAQGGEMENGDNLIEIRDQEIATAFALEALALVDHFHFRNSHPAPGKDAAPAVKKAAKAKLKAFNLYTDNKWSKSYYKSDDLHCIDRELFAK